MTATALPDELAALPEQWVTPALVDAVTDHAKQQQTRKVLTDRITAARAAQDRALAELNGGDTDAVDRLIAAVTDLSAAEVVIQLVPDAPFNFDAALESLQRCSLSLSTILRNLALQPLAYEQERTNWQAGDYRKHFEPPVPSDLDRSTAQTVKDMAEKVEAWRNNVRVVEANARSRNGHPIAFLAASASLQEQGETLAGDVEKVNGRIAHANTVRAQQGLTWSPHTAKPIGA